MQVTHENGLEESKSSINLGEIFSRYLAAWPLFLVLVAGALCMAWLYLKYTPPTYKASAKILLKDEKKGVDDSKAIESLNLLGTKKIVENEIEVVKSRLLTSEVVKNLYLYAPVTEDREWIPLSAYLYSPIMIEAAMPDSIKSQEKIYFEFDSKQQSVIIGAGKYPLGEWVSTPFGRLRFHPNKYATDPLKNHGRLYFSLLPIKQLSQDIANGILVSPVSKMGTILELSMNDQVPKRAEDILDELIAVYTKASIREKNILAANTLQFVEERLGHVSHDLDSIERALQAYTKGQEAVDLDEQGRLVLNNVSSSDRQLNDVNIQLAVLQQVEDYVRAKGNRGNVVPSTMGVNDPLLYQLLDNLYKAEVEYERLKKNTAENNPVLVSLSNQIAKIKPGILDNIISQKTNLFASQINLQSRISSFSQQLDALPQKQKELVSLNREQNIKSDIYIFLLKRREETALSFASTVSDTRVVETAEASTSPISPNRKMVYGVALVASLFLGIFTVFAYGFFNRKILTRKEIQTATIYPIVGEISYNKSKAALVIGDNNKTLIAEQFRKLRVSLDYLGISSYDKRILITSTLSGEGKSFVAANLALSMALTGKKVVLVELDLSNPSLCEKFDIIPDIGITNFLNKTAQPDEIIYPTDIDPNLYVVPAGPQCKNPSELIMKGKIESLLDYLNKRFDYIIIDTAPVGLVTDAFIVSAYCNATLYVVRQKYTPKMLVDKLDENNKVTNLNNIGIVFNGVKIKGLGGEATDSYGYAYRYSQKTQNRKLAKGGRYK